MQDRPRRSLTFQHGRRWTQLIQVTIDFLDLVGYPFLGKTFVTRGTFVHARDAEGIKEEFQDLMKRMGR